MWFYITCIVIIITLTMEQIFKMKFKKDMYKEYLAHIEETDGLSYEILKKVFNIGDEQDD